ncbi:hypothetical protein Bca4012_030613 [Brassica carinata]|uniref:Uncharacterized protein n=1 Tax=Brassica carinata TaxID=52824 RepID=A0A8X7RKB1_BRACI|nr:hypothetical protein Bca52824_048117 [Brassica carinata]
MVVTEECLEHFPPLSTGIRLTGKSNPLLRSISTVGLILSWLRLWIRITRREGAVATSRGNQLCFLDATQHPCLLLPQHSCYCSASFVFTQNINTENTEQSMEK